MGANDHNFPVGPGFYGDQIRNALSITGIRLSPHGIPIRGKGRFNVIFGLLKRSILPEMSISDTDGEILHMLMKILYGDFFVSQQLLFCHSIKRFGFPKSFVGNGLASQEPFPTAETPR
jgi:hypothetical protein